MEPDHRVTGSPGQKHWPGSMSGLNAKCNWYPQYKASLGYLYDTVILLSDIPGFSQAEVQLVIRLLGWAGLTTVYSLHGNRNTMRKHFKFQLYIIDIGRLIQTWLSRAYVSQWGAFLRIQRPLVVYLNRRVMTMQCELPDSTIYMYTPYCLSYESWLTSLDVVVWTRRH